jgi:hypothetical protein
VRKKGQSNRRCAPKKSYSSGLSVFLNFQVFALPEIGNSAAKAAAHADFVGLSMYRNAQLSVQTGDWIERWSGLITDTKSALVALPDQPGKKPGSAASTLDYLRKVTDWKGISSYTHTFLSLNKVEKIPLCLHELTVRKRTKRLILRPHLERLSPLDRREVTPSNLLLAWECLLQI